MEKTASIVRKVPDQVDVRIVFDSVPSMGRHRVTLWDADGAVCWLTGGPTPESMRFTTGDMLRAEASIAPERGAASTTRPSKEWRLRVHPGAKAVLRVGPKVSSSTFAGLEFHVEGASVARG
jgi:hypothetical protein